MKKKLTTKPVWAYALEINEKAGNTNTCELPWPVGGAI
jgi:hypothetical protein